jgi:hypothetical protein
VHESFVIMVSVGSGLDNSKKCAIAAAGGVELPVDAGLPKGAGLPVGVELQP